MSQNREQFELAALENGTRQKKKSMDKYALSGSGKDVLTRAIKKATATDRKTFSSLEWKNVSFEVSDRVILKDISGSVSPGRLCAIIGASGAGKTSLLNILAGRLQGASRSSITGEIFLNGKMVDPRDLGGEIAYVIPLRISFSLINICSNVHSMMTQTRTPRSNTGT